MISWTAPTSNGGDLITKYVITSGPAGLTCTTTTLTCSVGPLTPGVSYTFSVVAYNSAGSSQPGTTSTPLVLPGVPGAPSLVTATATNTTAIVMWSAPQSTGGSPITSYTAISSPGALSCTTSSELFCSIDALTPGVNYTFSVTATNVVGTSPASSPTLPVPVESPATLKVTGSTVSVKWLSAPTSTTPDVTGYLVTLMPGNRQCTTTTRLSCVFTKVAKSKSYTVTLSLMTNAGVAISSVVTTSGAPVAKEQIVTISGFLASVKGLTKDQLAQIQKIALIIQKDKSRYVRLDGYTDNSATVGVNAKVAFVRVRTVLAQLELDIYRLHLLHITWAAFSHANGPFVASNATPQGRAANRRVTVTITLSN